MNNLTIRILRCVLVLTFLAMVVAQTLILPWLSAVFADDFPEVAYIRASMLAVSILVIACGEVVVVCTWKLLSMVQQDSIFSERAFGWVNWIVGAIVAACMLVLGVFVYTSFWVDIGQLGLTMAEFGAVIGGLTLALLLVTMRGLLSKATTLQSDLAEVI